MIFIPVEIHLLDEKMTINAGGHKKTIDAQDIKKNEEELQNFAGVVTDKLEEEIRNSFSYFIREGKEKERGFEGKIGFNP